MPNLSFHCLYGSQAEQYLKELSRLRMEVFRDFPYLYDGDLNYEENYLKTYFECSESFVVICKSEDEVVGASTAIPLKFETREVKEPFIKQDLDPNDYMYFGESVLLAQYRGLGVGRKFFEFRREAARVGHYARSCFCAVIRPTDHKHKPKNYRNLEGMWQKMGFHKEPGLTTTFTWKDVGDSVESPKQMQFWTAIN